MKTIQQKIYFIGLVFVSMTLSSCDDIYECLLDRNPLIHDKPLAIGEVGENYFGLITAEVSNEVNDDDYIYNFDIYGDIPPGISLDIKRRSIEIRGVPEEAGAFTFEVELYVETYDENGYDGNPTCDERTFREFMLQIEE